LPAVCPNHGARIAYLAAVFKESGTGDGSADQAVRGVALADLGPAPTIEQVLPSL